MAFFELNPTDVLSSVFTAHPSTEARMTLASGYGQSEPFYLFSGSHGVSRQYTTTAGTGVTGSFALSGSIKVIPGSQLSTGEKRALERLRSIYSGHQVIKPQNYASSSIYPSGYYNGSSMMIVNVPSLVCGSEIRPGSLKLSVGSEDQVYTDDARGGIYQADGRLVGSVFYQHGIAYIYTPATSPAISTTADFTASFSGTNHIPVTMYSCRLPRGEFNFSNNPSYTVYLTGSKRNEITTKDPKTFITSIGLYDENFKLVGVAKVSVPILHEENMSVTFRLKLAY